MHNTSVDLNLLSVFAAIYRKRNLTAAGGDLNLSQSAVSHALGRLRRQFDDPLFIRQGQSMEPTALAESLAAGILPGLEMMHGTIRDKGTFSAATARRVFRLGMNDYGGTVLLPGLVEHIRRSAPDVTLHIMHSTHEQRLRMLEEGTLDAVMGCHELGGRHTKSVELFCDREACILRHDHPLASGDLAPARFQDMPFIALSLSESGKNVLDMVLEKSGHQLHPVVTIQQELTVPELVRTTGLAGTMAERLARHTVRDTQLCIRPLPFPDALFTLRLFWHAAKDSEPGHVWLRDCIQTVAKALPPLGHSGTEQNQ